MENNLAPYLIAAFFIVVIATILYITFSVKFVHSSNGQLRVRVGWSKYIQRGGIIYSVSDDFAYHESKVHQKKLEDYIRLVIEANRCRQRPDNTVVKRFIRRQY